MIESTNNGRPNYNPSQCPTWPNVLSLPTTCPSVPCPPTTCPSVLSLPTTCPSVLSLPATCTSVPGQPTPHLPASQLHHTQQYVATLTTPGPGPYDQMQFNANNNMMYNIQPMPHYGSTTDPNMIWIFDDQWKQVSWRESPVKPLLPSVWSPGCIPGYTFETEPCIEPDVSFRSRSALDRNTHS